jgi:hypothetical protein
MLAKNLLQALGYRDGLFEQLADAVKDAILDWELTPSGEDGPPDDLLPMSPPLFVEAMRPRAEEALRRLAVAINDAPPDQVSELIQGPVAKLFVDLLREAVLIGVQMRLEATEASLTTAQRPEGDWAKRYRRMRGGRVAVEPELTGAETVDEALPPDSPGDPE